LENLQKFEIQEHLLRFLCLLLVCINKLRQWTRYKIQANKITSQIISLVSFLIKSIHLRLGLKCGLF